MTTPTKRPTGALVTGAELAKRLEVHTRTVRKWTTEGLPVAQPGTGRRPSRYDEAKARAWLRAREDRIRRGSAGLMTARTGKEHWQAQLAQQQYQVRAGTLLPVEDVERVWSGQVAAVRARLLLMPMALADKLHRIGKLDGAAGIEVELQRAIDEVLTELSTGQRKTSKPRRKRTASRTRRTKRPAK